MAEAGLNVMSAHRRPLVTAAAAGAVLFALWFVPTAKAAPERVSVMSSAAPRETATTATAAAHTEGHEQPRLADGGRAAEPLPYVAGGLAFLGAGGVLVLHAVRGGRAS